LHSLPYMLRVNLPNKRQNTLELLREKIAELEMSKIDGYTRWYIDVDELYYIQYNQTYQKIMGLKRAIIHHERHRVTDIIKKYL